MDKVKRFRTYLPILLIILLSFLVWFFNLYHYLSLDTLRLHQKSLLLFVSQHLFLSILAYCGLYIVIVGLSIPVATFMTLAGGILFGQWIGTMAVVISATLGATLLFVSAKAFSQIDITLPAETKNITINTEFQNIQRATETCHAALVGVQFVGPNVIELLKILLDQLTTYFLPTPLGSQIKKTG